jgi:hypothetical protein
MSKRATQLQYKGNCCDSCGLSVTEMLDRYGTFERMFEFHHVDPTSKDRQYERMMRQNLSRRQFDEIPVGHPNSPIFGHLKFLHP